MTEQDNETYGEKLERLEEISRYTSLIINSAISKQEKNMPDYLKALRKYSNEIPKLYSSCEDLTNLAQDVAGKRAIRQKRKIKKILQEERQLLPEKEEKNTSFGIGKGSLEERFRPPK